MTNILSIAGSVTMTRLNDGSRTPPSGKWSYNISPGLLVAYKRGTLRLEIRPT